MRNRSEIWCEASDICLNEIESRALLAMQNGEFPTLIFISLDLYAELQKQLATYSQMRLAGPTSTSLQSILTINTSAGALNFQQVKRLRNFLMVGRKEDFDEFVHLGIDPIFWNDQERARIDAAFEDVIILSGEED